MQLRSRRAIAALLCAGLAMVLASCTDEPTPPDSAPSASSETTTSSPASTTPSPTPEQEVLEAYQGWFVNGLTVAGRSDEEIRILMSTYGTPQMVDRIILAIANLTGLGRKPAGYVTFNDPKPAIVGQAAAVTECRDSSTEQIADLATGQIIGHGHPRTHYEAQLVRGEDSRWRVDSYVAEAGGC